MLEVRAVVGADLSIVLDLPFLAARIAQPPIADPVAVRAKRAASLTG